jgi:hypothetical protein
MAGYTVLSITKYHIGHVYLFQETEWATNSMTETPPKTRARILTKTKRKEWLEEK